MECLLRCSQISRTKTRKLGHQNWPKFKPLTFLGNSQAFNNQGCDTWAYMQPRWPWKLLTKLCIWLTNLSKWNKRQNQCFQTPTVSKSAVTSWIYLWFRPFLDSTCSHVTEIIILNWSTYWLVPIWSKPSTVNYKGPKDQLTSYRQMLICGHSSSSVQDKPGILDITSTVNSVVMTG